MVFSIVFVFSFQICQKCFSSSIVVNHLALFNKFSSVVYLVVALIVSHVQAFEIYAARSPLFLYCIIRSCSWSTVACVINGSVCIKYCCVAAFVVSC